NGQDLARWTRSLDIDYGIYYLGPNDLRRQLGHANIPLGQGTRADLALFRVLVRALDAPPRILESWAGRRLEAGQLASMRNDLDRVLTATGMLGVRPILATHALRADPGATGEVAHRQVGEASALLALTPEATLAAFHDYNDMIRKVSEARNLPMADIRAAVPGDPANWGDATHFRDPGSRLAAQAFAATILADLAR
ncbi:MAG: hypothetical protein QGG40_08540, partial [Myxococcota bacterium]|nr:hypothetical protein [Myxococcota bacterium]